MMKLNDRIRSSLIPVMGMLLTGYLTGCTGSGSKNEGSGSNGGTEDSYKGVKIGAISYSWRSMPSTPGDIISYCKESGITTIELMGEVAEEWAGAPARPGFPENFRELTQEERDAFREKRREHDKEMSEWRIHQATPEMYADLKKMFDEAGIRIHIVKFAPAGWSDAEIDYAFESARILGAEGVTNEIGHEACERLAPFAEKHNMYAIFHNHEQPGDSTFNFEDYLVYSPKIMLNFDAGHYMGATGKDPLEVIEKLHDRIFSIHLKDKTSRNGTPPDTNMPWGQGDTPIGEILKLIQQNHWDIYCDIELEYPIPEGSDAVTETTKLFKYCKELLDN